MKIFNKLCATITLAVGLLAASCAHAWPIGLYILYDEKNNHINCIWGDRHASSPIEQEEIDCIQITEKKLSNLLNSNQVKCIVEAHEIIDRPKQEIVKKLPLLLRLTCTEYKTPVNAADWRPTNIKDMVGFHKRRIIDNHNNPLTKIRKAIQQACYNLDSKNPQNTKKLENIQKVYQALTQQSCMNFAHIMCRMQKICPNKPNTLSFVIQKITGINPYSEITEWLHTTIPNQCSMSLQQFLEENEKIKTRIQKTKTATKHMSQQAQQIIKVLTKANQSYEKLSQTEQKQPLAQKITQDAINQGDLSLLGLNNLRKKYPWYNTWITSIPEFGFITEIINSRTTYPITLTYVGSFHADALAKYFSEQEGYTCAYKKVNYQDNRLEKQDYTEFFTILEHLKNKLTHKKKI